MISIQNQALPMHLACMFELKHLHSKLFLLALLAIWGAPPPAPHHRLGLLDVFADGALDRAWVVRNVLGGMSAGFGLRGACPGSSLGAN